MVEMYILSIKKKGELVFEEVGAFNSIDEAVTKVRWRMLNGIELDGINIRRKDV